MNITELQEKDFEKSVLQHKGVTCVKFYATWCGPCRMLSQVMKDINDKKYDAINVVEVDVDNAHKLAQKHGVMSIPTMIFYKDGEIIDKQVGFLNETQLKDLFDKFID